MSFSNYLGSNITERGQVSSTTYIIERYNIYHVYIKIYLYEKDRQYQTRNKRLQLVNLLREMEMYRPFL